MRHLISPQDLSLEELEELLTLGQDIMNNQSKYAHVCDGKKLATLFYEPSTRTRLSFEAAMINMGGQVLGFSEASSSSAQGRKLCGYDTCHLLLRRYLRQCAIQRRVPPTVAAMHSSIPVINAGDGGHNHPTQTLTDLLTIKTETGRLDNLTIGMCGDLKFGRTVHSLTMQWFVFLNVKFVLISPEELRIPSYLRREVLDDGQH